MSIESVFKEFSPQLPLEQAQPVAPVADFEMQTETIALIDRLESVSRWAATQFIQRSVDIDLPSLNAWIIFDWDESRPTVTEMSPSDYDDRDKKVVLLTRDGEMAHGSISLQRKSLFGKKEEVVVAPRFMTKTSLKFDYDHMRKQGIDMQDHIANTNNQLESCARHLVRRCLELGVRP